MPQTGTKASGQMQSLQGPSLTMSTPAQSASHLLPYVLPSAPHTGAYSVVQIQSSFFACAIISISSASLKKSSHWLKPIIPPLRQKESPVLQLTTVVNPSAQLMLSAIEAK